ncbi:MAG: RNA polymerase sigma factor [Taibaiella sp.]|nr:RNA polymerase sigma factor [Taibaiella sp.]
MTAADFDSLIVSHSQFLHPYAITLTHDQEDAKDLYQETVMRALINRDKYQLGTNLKGWLYTIMRNVFINKYRRSKKIKFINPDGEYDDVLYPIQQQAQNNGWQQLRLREIWTAIENLPHAFRLSFELHYTGYKYHEIATMLSEPLGTVKSRIHMARKILANKIDR